MYKDRLGIKVAKKREYEAEQKKLKKKYRITEDGVIQVRKKRILEILIRAGADAIHTITQIMLVVLATIGLMALVYTAPRTDLRIIFGEIVGQLVMLLGL